jgi:hypothetical protein
VLPAEFAPSGSAGYLPPSADRRNLTERIVESCVWCVVAQVTHDTSIKNIAPSVRRRRKEPRLRVRCRHSSRCSLVIVEVRKRVAEVARKHGKITVTVAGKANVKDYVSMGYNMLSVGADVVALATYADDMLSAFDAM